MTSAFNTTAAVIEKHWAKKTQVLVQSNELKQTELPSATGRWLRRAWQRSFGCLLAPTASPGSPGSTRSPPSCCGARPTSWWPTGGQLRLSVEESRQAGGEGQLAVGVVISTWFELADEAKTPEAPSLAEIVFVPDGIERCVDFQLKSSPVLGTTKGLPP